MEGGAKEVGFDAPPSSGVPWELSPGIEIPEMERLRM